MVPALVPSPEAVKSSLESDYPGWRFLRSDRGRWWALRGPLPRDRINEVDTVEANTPEELRVQLANVTGGGAR